MTKVLVIGLSYVADETRRSLTQLWWKVLKQVNPELDVLLVDSCSPFDPTIFLPEAEVFRFSDNIGAISRMQKDGSGRSFAYGLQTAMDRGYDYAVHFETDFLFAPKIMPVIERMKKSGVKVVSPGVATPYQFLEWGISFYDLNYIKESNFIKRYDWEHTPGWPVAEIRLEKMFGDNLFIIPFRGLRNDMNQVNVANLSNSFPYGPPDYITHCADFNLYLHFLNINKIAPL